MLIVSACLFVNTLELYAQDKKCKWRFLSFGNDGRSESKNRAGTGTSFPYVNRFFAWTYESIDNRISHY